MRTYEWEALPDAELLEVRLRDLGVRIEGTWIEECVGDLYADLERRELPFRPHAWLSTDWFVPDAVPGIAIPFYPAHPRLMTLERRARGRGAPAPPSVRMLGSPPTGSCPMQCRASPSLSISRIPGS